MAGSVPIGALALELECAHDDLGAAHQKVDAFLEALFPGWRARFPMRLGWRRPGPWEIEIWEVTDSPAARDALARAGWATATLHDHSAMRFLTCTCMPIRTETT